MYARDEIFSNVVYLEARLRRRPLLSTRRRWYPLVVYRGVQLIYRGGGRYCIVEVYVWLVGGRQRVLV